MLTLTLTLTLTLFAIYALDQIRVERMRREANGSRPIQHRRRSLDSGVASSSRAAGVGPVTGNGGPSSTNAGIGDPPRTTGKRRQQADASPSTAMPKSEGARAEPRKGWELEAKRNGTSADSERCVCNISRNLACMTYFSLILTVYAASWGVYDSPFIISVPKVCIVMDVALRDDLSSQNKLLHCIICYLLRYSQLSSDPSFVLIHQSIPAL